MSRFYLYINPTRGSLEPGTLPPLQPRKTMTDEEVDELRDRLERYVGKPMGPPSEAPDPVNVPMIRHWVDAFDDRNPIYEDESVAAKTHFGGLVAPPAMLQTWLCPRPKIDGIGERRGMPTEDDGDSSIGALDKAGYIGSRIVLHLPGASRA